MPLIKQKHEMQPKRQAGKQQGFVLILALVLLAVLTLIGVSSMNTANIELKATANARQHQFAFNAAQSLVEFSVSKGTTVDYQPADLTIDQAVTFTSPDGSSASATVSYAGCASSVAGSSMEGGISYNFFNIAANGANATGTGSSLQSQGIRHPSASCNPTLIP